MGSFKRKRGEKSIIRRTHPKLGGDRRGELQEV